MKWPPVSRQLLLWQPPLRALAGLQNPPYAKYLRWSGRTAVGAPRSHPRPTRRQLAPLWVLWRCGIGQALRAVLLVSGLRPGMLCLPRPPVASPLRGIGPALGARPPPRGSLSPAPQGSTITVSYFAIKYIAACARYLGLQAVPACKPACRWFTHGGTEFVCRCLQDSENRLTSAVT